MLAPLGAPVRPVPPFGLRLSSSFSGLLPDDVRKSEAVRELAGYGCVTQMHLLPLVRRVSKMRTT
jgi:hypothetical protein